MILQLTYIKNIVVLVKIDTTIVNMQPNDKEPKHGVIHSFFRSSFKKRKVVDSTSTIDTSSQITETDEIVCCSTDKLLESTSPKTSSSSTSLQSFSSPSTFLPQSSSTSPCLSLTFLDQYRENPYYPLINYILIELNDCFSFENMQTLNGLSALCSNSDKFLQNELLKPFAAQMKVNLSLLP